MLAYQTGKAANVAPPATISHTSLPSQIGPMAFLASRRSMSSRPIARLRMPTPKSKPSSTKYPAHSRPIRANHEVFKLATGPVITSLLIDEFLGGRLTLGAGRRLCTLAGVGVAPGGP